jgi:hypothetical protein
VRGIFSPHIAGILLIGANHQLRVGAERTVSNGIACSYGSFTGRVEQESSQYTMTIVAAEKLATSHSKGLGLPEESVFS